MSRKVFGVHDHALWDDLKKSFMPLHCGKRHQSGKKLSAGPTLPSNAQPHVPSIRRTAIGSNPPPLMPFDRRLAQRLLRGQVEPDARLDLHGETVESTRMRLLHFLQSKQQLGHRIVLVITGKGSSGYARHTLHGQAFFHAPEREGRLRSEVPNLLHEAQFRVLAIGYQPAHPRHGGGGAIYVGLRRLGKQL